MKPNARITIIAAFLILLWAFGAMISEGVTQFAAYATLFFSIWLLVKKRVVIPPDLRLLAVVSFIWAGWQAFSPFLAKATHAAAHFPRASRWSQALDTLTTMALMITASIYVPWRSLGYLLGIGWLLETIMGFYQSLVRWPWGSMGPLHLPLARLHDNFGAPGGPERYAGLGFFFHRLRYAHGAMAILGPALAFTAQASKLKGKTIAAIITLSLILCTYISFTRAALAASLAMVVIAIFVLMRGRYKFVALIIVLAASSTLAFSPSWRTRISLIIPNLIQHDRALAVATGIKIVSGHPLLGVGFGNYKEAASPYIPSDPYSQVLTTSAHNIWITIWAETGLLGLLIALAWFILLGKALWTRYRDGSAMAAGALLSLIGFIAINLFHYVPFHPGTMLTFTLIWGLGLAPQPHQLKFQNGSR